MIPFISFFFTDFWKPISDSYSGSNAGRRTFRDMNYQVLFRRRDPAAGTRGEGISHTPIRARSEPGLLSGEVDPGNYQQKQVQFYTVIPDIRKSTNSSQSERNLRDFKNAFVRLPAADLMILQAPAWPIEKRACFWETVF